MSTENTAKFLNISPTGAKTAQEMTTNNQLIEGELDENDLDAIAGGGLKTFTRKVYEAGKEFIKDVLD